MPKLSAARAAEVKKAREADERIAAAWGEFWAVEEPRRANRRSLADLERRARQDAARGREESEYTSARREELEAAHGPLQARAEALSAAAVALDELLYTGWPRFFHVKHIHATRYCSSFRPTTRVGWLPDVSGLTEAEAVAAHGATLCTICYPSAPVELTTPQLDPALCPGSGHVYDTANLTGREGAYYSPQGTCAECGARVGLTARGSGKVRKHKRA